MDRHAFAQMWHHRFDPSRYLIALQFQAPTSSNTSDLSRLGIQEYAGAVKDMRSRGLPMTCLLVFACNCGTYIAKEPWSAQSQRWTKDEQLTRRSKRVDFDQQLQNWWAKLQDQCLAKVSAWTTIATTRATAFSSRWRATRVMLHFMLLPLILTRDLLAAHLHPRGLPRWKRLGGRLHALQTGQACFVVATSLESRGKRSVSVFKVILSQETWATWECKVRAAKINMPISVYCPELDAGVAHDLWTAKARQMSEMCQTANLMLFLFIPFGIRISSHMHRCFVLICLVLGSQENKQ